MATIYDQVWLTQSKIQERQDRIRKASTHEEHIAILYSEIEALDLYVLTQKMILTLLINATVSKEDKDKVMDAFHSAFSGKIEPSHFALMKLSLEEILSLEV